MTFLSPFPINGRSIFVSVAFFMFSSASVAEVIDADGHPLTSTTHTGAILDTSTSLIWLDATETTNRSLSDVSSQLGRGQEFEGWQVATMGQIEQLFENAGLVDTNSAFRYDAAALENVMSFVDIYGETDTAKLGPPGIKSVLLGTSVWHADSVVNPIEHGTMVAKWLSTDDRVWVGRSGSAPLTVGDAFDRIGTALVRTTVPGDFDLNGQRDVLDVEELIVQMNSGQDGFKYDINDDAVVDSNDLVAWVKDLNNGWIGDANLDGEFNSSDFVQVFAAGKYEFDEPASWTEGDWNGDKRFNSGDFVAAFKDGGYEQGSRTAILAVPEPSAWILLGYGLFGIQRFRNERRNQTINR